MNKQHQEQQDIWFYNPMVWFIIILPLTVVIASMITISIAIKNKPVIIQGPNIAISKAEEVKLID